MALFWADMSSSVHIDNKNKDISVLGEGPTQRLDETILITEEWHPISFTQLGKRFVLRVHYNGSSSFLFVNATKIYQFKANDSEKKNYKLCLVTTLKFFTINNTKKKTGLKGSVKLFSIDFNPIDTNDTLDIHKYLMKGA